MGRKFCCGLVTPTRAGRSLPLFVFVSHPHAQGGHRTSDAHKMNFY